MDTTRIREPGANCHYIEFFERDPELVTRITECFYYAGHVILSGLSTSKIYLLQMIHVAMKKSCPRAAMRIVNEIRGHCTEGDVFEVEGCTNYSLYSLHKELASAAHPSVSTFMFRYGQLPVDVILHAKSSIVAAIAAAGDVDMFRKAMEDLYLEMERKALSRTFRADMINSLCAACACRNVRMVDFLSEMAIPLREEDVHSIVIASLFSGNLDFVDRFLRGKKLSAEYMMRKCDVSSKPKWLQRLMGGGTVLYSILDSVPATNIVSAIMRLLSGQPISQEAGRRYSSAKSPESCFASTTTSSSSSYVSTFADAMAHMRMANEMLQTLGYAVERAMCHRMKNGDIDGALFLIQSTGWTRPVQMGGSDTSRGELGGLKSGVGHDHMRGAMAFVLGFRENYTQGEQMRVPGVIAVKTADIFPMSPREPRDGVNEEWDQPRHRLHDDAFDDVIPGVMLAASPAFMHGDGGRSDPPPSPPIIIAQRRHYNISDNEMIIPPRMHDDMMTTETIEWQSKDYPLAKAVRKMKISDRVALCEAMCRKTNIDVVMEWKMIVMLAGIDAFFEILLKPGLKKQTMMNVGDSWITPKTLLFAAIRSRNLRATVWVMKQVHSNVALNDILGEIFVRLNADEQAFAMKVMHMGFEEFIKLLDGCF
jgi:hypothetical protein